MCGHCSERWLALKVPAVFWQSLESFSHVRRAMIGNSRECHRAFVWPFFFFFLNLFPSYAAKKPTHGRLSSLSVVLLKNHFMLLAMLRVSREGSQLERGLPSRAPSSRCGGSMPSRWPLRSLSTSALHTSEEKHFKWFWWECFKLLLFFLFWRSWH